MDILQRIPIFGWAISAGVVLAIGGFFIAGKEEGAEAYEYVVATTTDVVREVTVTGHVKPASGIDLSFDQAGTLAALFVEVGDRVDAGDPIASLINDDIRADLDQARATAAYQEAQYDLLISGARTEAIQLDRAKVVAAEQSLEDASRSAVDALGDAYTAADDAIRNKVDQFFDNPRTNIPQVTFSLSDVQLRQVIESGRVTIEGVLVAWEVPLAASAGPAMLSLALENSVNRLRAVRDYLASVALAVNSLKADTSQSQATIDGYRTDIGTARSQIDTALSSLTAAQTAVRSGVSSLEVVRRTLALTEAPLREEDRLAAAAKLTEARAALRRAHARLNKTALSAPFDAVVDKKNVTVGESVGVHEPIVRLSADAALTIEMFVPETDVVSLAIGDTARVSFDAYDGLRLFAAAVTSIESAETIIEGVPTYKTTLILTTPDEHIRSGMTATIIIETERREGVVAVPGRSVIESEGRIYVRILNDDTIVEERDIVTGVRGSDGMVEVSSGVSLGDRVIVFTR